MKNVSVDENVEKADTSGETDNPSVEDLNSFSGFEEKSTLVDEVEEDDEIDQDTERRLLEGEEELKGEEEDELSEGALEDLREQQAVLECEGIEEEVQSPKLLTTVENQPGNEGEEAVDEDASININYLEESLLAFDREQEQMAAKGKSADSDDQEMEVADTLDVQEVKVEGALKDCPGDENKTAVGGANGQQENNGSGDGGGAEEGGSMGQDSGGQGGGSGDDGGGEDEGNLNRNNNITDGDNNEENNEEEEENEEKEESKTEIDSFKDVNVAVTIKKLESSTSNSFGSLNSSVSISRPAISSSNVLKDLCSSITVTSSKSSNFSFESHSAGLLGSSISITSAKSSQDEGNEESLKRKADDLDGDENSASSTKRRKSASDDELDEKSASRSELQKKMDRETAAIESKLGAAISLTLKNNSSLSITDASKPEEEEEETSEKSSSKYSGETERIMSMLRTVNIKKIPIDKEVSEKEEGSSGNSDKNSCESSDISDNISKISKQVSISSVSVKTVANNTPRERSSSPNDSTSLPLISSSISISKTTSNKITSNPCLPASVTVTSVSSSVSVIKNLESEKSEKNSSKDSETSVSNASSDDACGKSSETLKSSKEIPSLLQISKDVDVKPILNEKGAIVSSKERSHNKESSNKSNEGNSKDLESSLPSGVDTSKLNASISILPVTSSSEKHKVTSTMAPSRPSSSTSARSSSASPANSSSSPAIGNISVKTAALLQDNTSSVPPPPPLSQPSSQSVLQKSGGQFNSPSIPKLSNHGHQQVSGPSCRLMGPAAKIQQMMRGGGPMIGPGGGHMPPEAGPLSSQLHQHSHKLAEMMRASLEEVLTGILFYFIFFNLFIFIFLYIAIFLFYYYFFFFFFFFMTENITFN